MLNNNPISRRRFLRSSAVGIGSFGIGMSHSSELFTAPGISGNPSFPGEKISPREVCVLNVTKVGIDGDTSEKIVEKMLDRETKTLIHLQNLNCFYLYHLSN